MITLDVRVRLQVTGDHDLEVECEKVMSALLLLEGDSIGDTAVSVDLERRMVTIELTARADTFEEAEQAASSTIRAAIHKTGGLTPGWDVSGRSAELTSA